MKKPERIKKAVELMLKNEDKYCSLVWYARANPDKHSGSIKEAVLKGIKDVENKFPKETASFNEEGANDWEHGFNSGMLAASRLYLSMIEYNVEQALEDFPELDS